MAITCDICAIYLFICCIGVLRARRVGTQADKPQAIEQHVEEGLIHDPPTMEPQVIEHQVAQPGFDGLGGHWPRVSIPNHQSQSGVVPQVYHTVKLIHMATKECLKNTMEEVFLNTIKTNSTGSLTEEERRCPICLDEIEEFVPGQILLETHSAATLQCPKGHFFGHWSLDELNYRVDIDLFFEISQQDWVQQLVVTLLGFQAVDSIEDTAECLERGRIILRALCSRAMRSRWPSNIQGSRVKDILDRAAVRYTEPAQLQRWSDWQFEQTFGALSEDIVDMAVHIRWDEYLPSSQRNTAEFWTNECLERRWTERKTIPLNPNRWVSEERAARIAYQQLRKRKGAYGQGDGDMDEYLIQRMNLLLMFLTPMFYHTHPILPRQYDVMLDHRDSLAQLTGRRH
ncbi:uncharacterized protein BP5553_01192 [Venustampulla echinocandica]|uniref:RING-type domain-containing protein n=1 Tax=Venustampulla echinocandica TaxID=2656787 RepID=A0A370U0C9_9HELO|nr:uncharacterized protein BP5553_01192 [Venustampulla echinocandica]RDL41213.1 hypothetical protein BP5553_01192 [Venustampulla echinocandica]